MACKTLPKSRIPLRARRQSLKLSARYCLQHDLAEAEQRQHEQDAAQRAADGGGEAAAAAAAAEQQQEAAAGSSDSEPEQVPL